MQVMKEQFTLVHNSGSTHSHAPRHGLDGTAQDQNQDISEERRHPCPGGGDGGLERTAHRGWNGDPAGIRPTAAQRVGHRGGDRRGGAGRLPVATCGRLALWAANAHDLHAPTSGLPQPGHAPTAPQDAWRGQNHRAARASALELPSASQAEAWILRVSLLALAALFALAPELALAGSPFATGAQATQQQLTSILTPIAAVAVMVSGAMAWFGRLSWWWMVAVVIGTVLVFGGPQIVSWIRGLFGV